MHKINKIILGNEGDGYICCRSAYSCSIAANMSFISSINNIYCGGCGSCHFGVTIHGKSSTANVMCSGGESCILTKINTTGNVTCSGDNSCKYATISNADSVFCGGTQSCDRTTLIGVSNIYIMGSQGIVSYGRYASIISNGNNMDVHFMSYYSGDDVTIHCNKTDICSIYCYTNGACHEETTHIDCEGMSCTVCMRCCLVIRTLSLF